MVQNGKKSEEMESNGNRLRGRSSKPAQIRCTTTYANNARNLTFALGVNEFSLTSEESGEVRFLLVLFYSARKHLHVFRYEDEGW